MVSAKTLFATSATLLATIASVTASVAKIYSIRDSDPPCGSSLIPPEVHGIVKPADGTIITYTSEEQENFNGATFEIIYCSSAFFKTSSLNITVVLGDLYSGTFLGSTEPSAYGPLGGIYSYGLNVTIFPEEGYITGPQKLSVFEVETGYYTAYIYNLYTVTIDLEMAPTKYTS